jgi:exosortase
VFISCSRADFILKIEILSPITLSIPRLNLVSHNLEMRQASFTSKPLPELAFAVLCALSFEVWYQPLVHTLALAMKDERYTHILLILPVSAALIVQQWRENLRNVRPSAAGAGLLLFSFFLLGLARWGGLGLDTDLTIAVSMTGLVLWWIGSFLVCFGVQSFRTLAFPFIFLFWMVPLPQSFLARIIEWLQHGSAIAAQLLFSAAGMPATRDGILLFLPGLTLEVAPECSSIRSSMMLIVTTMLLAQMLLRSPWRKAFVMAIAVPLCLAKNGLRIFVLGMLATQVDPTFMTGRFHHHGGVVFFALALAAIFMLLWILRRGEPAMPKAAGLPMVRPIGA